MISKTIPLWGHRHSKQPKTFQKSHLEYQPFRVHFNLSSCRMSKTWETEVTKNMLPWHQHISSPAQLKSWCYPLPAEIPIINISYVTKIDAALVSQESLFLKTKRKRSMASDSRPFQIFVRFFLCFQSWNNWKYAIWRFPFSANEQLPSEVRPRSRYVSWIGEIQWFWHFICLHWLEGRDYVISIGLLT